MAVYTVARSQIQPWVASFIITSQATAPPFGRIGAANSRLCVGIPARTHFGGETQVSKARPGPSTRRSFVPKAQFLASSFSSALTSAGSSGVVLGENRAVTFPVRSMMNFSKFQRISGSAFGSMPWPFNLSLNGCSEVLIAFDE